MSLRLLFITAMFSLTTLCAMATPVPTAPTTPLVREPDSPSAPSVKTPAALASQKITASTPLLLPGTNQSIPASMVLNATNQPIASPLANGTQPVSTSTNATERIISMPANFGTPSAIEASKLVPLVPKLSPEQLSSGFALLKLANGMQVLIKKDDRFPLVSLRLYVHAGSSYESPEDAGISHVLEHMVFKGTDAYPKGSIATAVEASGGYLNAATSFDYTVYLTDMTVNNWQKGLSVLKEMAFSPTLDATELAAEKDVIVAELKRGDDSPGSRLFRMMQALIFKGTPYAHPIIGYEKTIRSFTPERIRAYIDKYYQPQSMLLLICGDVDMNEALAIASTNFSTLKNTEAVMDDPLRHRIPVATGFAADVQTGPWKKVTLALAFPAPGQNDALSARLDVLSQLLGGDATSRFYHSYKYEKRLVDSISVVNYGFEHTGLLFIQATLDPDKVVPFWTTLIDDLGKMNALKFTPKELERAQLAIEDDLFRSKETLSGLAAKMGYFRFFSGGQEAEANYLDTVKNTSSEALASEAVTIFNPSKAALTVLLPDGIAQSAYKLPKNASSVEEWMKAEFIRQLQPKTPTEKELAPTAKAKAEVITLDNDRTIILMPDDTLPYTAATLMFTGGNALLKENDQGLGAFAAALLTRGTTKLTATAIEEYQSNRASVLNAASGRQTFTLSINGPARYFDDMFTLMHDSTVMPGLKKQEAERVRENQLAAIVSVEDAPTALAFRRMNAFLFQGHTYGYLQLGEADTVKTFTTEKAKAFWQQQTKQPWVLAVSGAFDRDTVIKAAKNLPVPSAKAPFIATPRWADTKELDLPLPGRQQAHLLMVFPTVPIGDTDEPGLDLLQNILAGQSGLLFRDLRDKQGLGYTVTAIPMKTQKAGALIFYIGTAPNTVAQAEKGFATVIEELQQSPLPDEELNRAKQQMTGDYYRERQRLAARSNEAATLATLGFPLDAEQHKITEANKLTPADIQKIANKYLTPKKAYLIKVLP